MQKYLARRALFALATLFGVSLIIFVVLRVLPGDPLVAILGVEGHARMTPADRVKIMHDLGLSDPLPLQYLHWLRDIASGQLGKSFFRGDTVAQLILHRGPISAEIGLLALIVSWLVGLPIGILSAVKPNSIIDNLARSCLLEVIHEDYVRTARAKGVLERRVIMSHALPNALLPVITISGVLLGFVLGGSVAVEQAFGVPGLGRALVIALIERDIIVVQNLVLLYASIFVIINVLVDLSYAWLDPRIRYG